VIAALVRTGALAGALGAPPGSNRIDVTGLWNAPGDGGSTVRLEHCDHGLCGYIVTSPHIQADPAQRDIRNRDVAQRGRPLRNLMFMKVRSIGPGRWGDGWIYNPEDGGTYKGVMTLHPDGALSLKGCVVAPFCKTQTWRRAS
jgi:uncharacterized protein (DUF2147 family)